jgi:threonyl-tRNA synthetase
MVMNITDRQADFVTEVAKTLRDKGFRVETDLRNEKIGFKIREHTLQRVPYLLVAGDREVEARQISVRDRKGNDLGTQGLDDLILRLQDEVERKGLMGVSNSVRIGASG